MSVMKKLSMAEIKTRFAKEAVKEMKYVLQLVHTLRTIVCNKRVKFMK
jgi:hypothetical protein